jgi:homoserine O-acetyltransferase
MPSLRPEGLLKEQKASAHFTFDDLPLSSGKTFGPVTLAYETWGALNAAKDNAVLLAHDLFHDARAAGPSGWWDALIGPGKPLDTDRYFIVSSNVLGGCSGSTGPSSLEPLRGAPYALDFPPVSVADMVQAQRRLVDRLGISRLRAVIGASLGGMQALQWAATFPERVAGAAVIASTLKHSPQQIAFHEVARQAVMSDPRWRGGWYDGHGAPEDGLALARMVGEVTRTSARSLEERFSRRFLGSGLFNKFGADFQVEGFLRSKAGEFTSFDANSFLYLTKAMDQFYLPETQFPALLEDGPRFLVIAFTSDWLYPPEQSREIVRRLKAARIEASYAEIPSDHGHDAFLVEHEAQGRLLRGFLEGLS